MCGFTVHEISLLPSHEDETRVESVDKSGVVLEYVEDRIGVDGEESLSFAPVAQIVRVGDGSEGIDLIEMVSGASGVD